MGAVVMDEYLELEAQAVSMSGYIQGFCDLMCGVRY